MKRGTWNLILAAAAAGFLAVTMPSLPTYAAEIKLTSGKTVSTTTVKGTIAKGTTSSLLILSASEGTYQCKMDSDTNFNGITTLVIGYSAEIEVYNGSDGYLHVARFNSSSASSSSSGSSSSSSSTSSSAAKQTTDVAGTIKQDTSNSMLYLSTSAGDMTIRIDSDCDLTKCGTLVAGNQAIASVYRGDDAYMHASRIVSGASGVDLTNLLTVSGTVTSATTNSLISLSTTSGTYQLKWDTATDVAISGVLYSGKTVTAVIGRGSDAYYHAIKVTDGTTAPSSSSSGSNSGTSSSSNVNTVTISGGVTTSSDESKIIVETANGTYTVYLDDTTDYSACPVIVAKYSVKAEIYIGSDSQYHAKKLTDLSSNSQGSADGVNSANAVQVTGTVEDGTNQNLLRLNVGGNTMLIRIDQKTDCSKCRVLKQGITVTAKVARGSDAYMHATSLVDNSYGSGSSGTASLGDSGMLTGQSTTVVTGTIQSGSTEDFLILRSSGEDYKIRLDSGSDRTDCKVLIAGENCKAAIYKGSDGYLHAAKLVDLSPNYPGGAGTLDASTKMTLEGTVASGTAINMLNLNINGGIMKIKIDDSTDTSKCRVLKEGKKLKVEIERGSDSYLHAVSIVAE